MLGFGTPISKGIWTPSIAAVLSYAHPNTTLLPAAMSVMNDLVTDTMLRLLRTAETFAASLDDSPGNEAEDTDSYFFTASHYTVVNAGLVREDGSLDASHTVKLYHCVDDTSEEQAPGAMHCLYDFMHPLPHSLTLIL